MTPSRCEIHIKGLYPIYSSISFSASVNFIHKIAPPVRNVVTYTIWNHCDTWNIVSTVTITSTETLQARVLNLNGLMLKIS